MSFKKVLISCPACGFVHVKDELMYRGFPLRVDSETAPCGRCGATMLLEPGNQNLVFSITAIEQGGRLRVFMKGVKKSAITEQIVRLLRAVCDEQQKERTDTGNESNGHLYECGNCPAIADK